MGVCEERRPATQTRLIVRPHEPGSGAHHTRYSTGPRAPGSYPTGASQEIDENTTGTPCGAISRADRSIRNMPNCCAPIRVDRAGHSRRGPRSILRSSSALTVWLVVGVFTSIDAAAQAPAAMQADQPPDPVKQLVERLDLEKYKATIKGLTQFGDRQQGTDRNRAAVDWIESQLKSVGCASTERIRYEYQPPATPRRRPARGPREGEGGSVMFGNRVPTSVNRDAE